MVAILCWRPLLGRRIAVLNDAIPGQCSDCEGNCTSVVAAWFADDLMRRFAMRGGFLPEYGCRGPCYDPDSAH